jgi:FKBP12-rapamycin complex-associated protein
MRGEPLPDYTSPATRDSPSQTRATEEIGINKPVSTPKAGSINNQVLSSAWDTSRCFTKTDWFEWIRKLSIALLSESSSPALRRFVDIHHLGYDIGILPVVLIPFVLE